MKRKINVGVFWLLAIVAIILIFALNRKSYPDFSEQENKYKKNIQVLNDTIKLLQGDIEKYQKEIERIDKERHEVIKEIEQILKENEKVDAELSNGDWDTNIRFLTEFLSEKDPVE